MKRIKRLISCLLCAVMLTVLSLSAMGTCAYADDSYEFISGTEKSETVYGGWWRADDPQCIYKAELCDGTVLPKGLKLSHDLRYIYVYGTPSETGTFHIKIYMEVFWRDEHYEISDYDPSIDTLEQNIYACDIVVKDAFQVTKSPTSETVIEGDEAMFISAATSYSKVEWRVVTKDGNNCWRNKNEIEGKFTGVQYNAYKGNDGREYLVLKNIPLTMDGYYIQTKYWNKDESQIGLTEDHSCLLSVKEYIVPKPIIKEQPSGAELKEGQWLSLEVMAEAPEGELNYQWYTNSTDSTAGGTKITGATAWKCSAEPVEGTVYYYCELTATNRQKTSEPVFTKPAAVTYVFEKEPTPTPTPTPQIEEPENTPAPPANTPSETPAAKVDLSEKTDDPVPENVQRAGGNKTVVTVLAIAAGAVVIAAAAVIIATLRKRR